MCGKNVIHYIYDMIHCNSITILSKQLIFTIVQLHYNSLLQKWGAIYEPKSLWDLKSEIISLHFIDFTTMKLFHYNITI
jgi:hypothetical protein